MQISPQNVVGRDRLIEQIWRKLESESLRFTAERRIGKTTVMQKMLAEPKPGTQLLFLDLEKAESSQRFTEVLLTEMKPLLSARTKAALWFPSFLKDIGGTEIGGVVKLPERNRIGWKAVLEKAFGGVCSQNPRDLIVLLFDELPYMLQKITANERSAGSTDRAALEIVDTLRAMRHEHGNLRMIFAGSIGLHHVLNDLRGTDYASQPVNDMFQVDIGPLAIEDAILLGKRLLDDERVTIAPDESASVLNELASLTDRVPFYIKRVVSCLSDADDPIAAETVRQIVRQQLTDDHDAWEMEHFRTRLKIYYQGTTDDAGGKPIPNASLASAILDILATAPRPQTIDEVWSAIKARIALDNREQVIQLLRLMTQDHYLTCDSDKHYEFRFPLIRRWWILAQGLAK